MRFAVMATSTNLHHELDRASRSPLSKRSFSGEAANVGVAYVPFLAFSFHAADRWRGNMMESASSPIISPS